MTERIGERFIRETKYHRGRLPSHRLDWATQPRPLKEYPSAKRYPLPAPETGNGPGLWEAVNRRRSIRAYTGDAMSVKELSQILWATQGITAEVGSYRLRAAPSAGALYPIETYLSVHRVEGLPAGLYHYAVNDHELELLKEGDFSREVRAGALDQQIAERAAVVFIWSAVFLRSAWKYLDRAYRYVFLDAGHIAQNLALAAAGLGLGSCQIGALYDDEMNRLLDLDGVNESVIYMSSVGRPRR